MKNIDFKIYEIVDRETGTRIDYNLSQEEAIETTQRYEQEDLEDDIFVEDFYEIRVMEEHI